MNAKNVYGISVQPSLMTADLVPTGNSVTSNLLLWMKKLTSFTNLSRIWLQKKTFWIYWSPKFQDFESKKKDSQKFVPIREFTDRRPKFLRFVNRFPWRLWRLDCKFKRQGVATNFRSLYKFMSLVCKLKVKEFFRRKESIPLSAPGSRRFWLSLDYKFNRRVSIPP